MGDEVEFKWIIFGIIAKVIVLNKINFSYGIKPELYVRYFAARSSFSHSLHRIPSFVISAPQERIGQVVVRS